MAFEPKRRPQLVAHKGNSWDFAENTLRAAKSAVDHGADMVEIDVSRTRDGILVALHGPKLETTSTVSGWVTRTRFEVLEAARARDRNGDPTEETIPRLVDLLDALGPDVAVNLDVKQPLRAATDTVRLVAERRLQDRCVVSGLTAFWVGRALAADPDVVVLLNLNRFDKLVARLPRVATRWLPLRYRRLLRRRRVLGINLNHDFVTPELVSAVIAVGGEVWTFTVDEAERAEALVAMGVASITTNRPAGVSLNG